MNIELETEANTRSAISTVFTTRSAELSSRASFEAMFLLELATQAPMIILNLHADYVTHKATKSLHTCSCRKKCLVMSNVPIMMDVHRNQLSSAKEHLALDP